uniref:biotin/lipoyl-containing protein n=1 Tax=Gemmatimonas sp. TaxID=1962908 RepID=UPI00286A0657
MARVDVIMPQMGESIAEGTVSRWLKKVGDNVKRDEPLFEISTDKVDAEIPSPSAGILMEILVGEGLTVAIQTVVARLETDAAAAALPAAAPSAPAAAPTAASVVLPSAPVAASAAPVVSAAPAGSFEERVRTKSSPLVRKMAAEHGVEIAGMSGSGIAGRVTRKDLDAFLAAKPAVAAAPVAGASMHVPAGVEQRGPLPSPW